MGGLKKIHGTRAIQFQYVSQPERDLHALGVEILSKYVAAVRLSN